MKSEFVLAINQICTERNLPQEVIFEAIESALVSAYRRNYGGGQNVKATIDRQTGQPHVFLDCIVVESVQDDRFEISAQEARRIDREVEVGGLIKKDVTPKSFGRIAAQTAKQVILQRIREAERDALFTSYADREGELINGTVANVTSHAITLNLGRTEAIMPRSQQVPGERYRIGQRVRAYVMEVRRSSRGPQIVVSRTHRHMLRRLLELEVPEIYNGTVEIKAIAREAGSRSKVAVAALQEGVDPVGSCVGIRGMRIQSIVSELGGEKIDVVEWNADTGSFIANALSPAKVNYAVLGNPASDGKTATVVVPDDQLSLAIGKEGQNARLAAKLTGWRIDIKSISEARGEELKPQAPLTISTSKEKDILAMAEAILLGKAPAEDHVALETGAQAEPVEAEAEAADAQVEPAEAQVESVEAVAEPVEAQAELVETVAEPVEAQAELAEVQAEPVEVQAEPVEVQAEPVEAQSLLEQAEELLRGQAEAEPEAPEQVVPVAEAVVEQAEPESEEPVPALVLEEQEASAEAAEAVETTEATAAEEPEQEERVILRRAPQAQPQPKRRPRFRYVKDERLESLEGDSSKPRRRRRRQLVLDEESGKLVSRPRHKRGEGEEWQEQES